MAVKNRGLPDSLGGFFNQYVLESIQRDTAEWCPDSPLFSEWVSTMDAADTGERSGLAKSFWGGGGEEDGAMNEPANSAGSVDEPLPLAKLIQSANARPNVWTPAYLKLWCTLQQRSASSRQSCIPLTVQETSLGVGSRSTAISSSIGMDGQPTGTNFAVKLRTVT